MAFTHSFRARLPFATIYCLSPSLEPINRLTLTMRQNSLYVAACTFARPALLAGTLSSRLVPRISTKHRD